MVAIRRISLLLVCSLFTLYSQNGSSDDFVMKDGTVIEGVIKSYDARSKEIVIEIDEKGKTKRIKERDIKYRIARKTSWQKRADALEWYEKNEPRRKDTYKDRENFGKRCRQKGIPDKAAIQFKLSHKFRKTRFDADLKEGKIKAKDEVKERIKFARWCSKLGLIEEALVQYEGAYTIKRKEMIADAKKKAKDKDDEKKKLSVAYFDLAKWCGSVDLEEQAMTNYEKSLDIDPNNTRAQREMAKIKESIAYKFKQLAKKYDEDGRAWHLTVTIEDQVGKDVFDEWQEKMQNISLYIFEITQGQFYIATCKIEDDTSGGRIIVEKGKLKQAGMQGNSGVLAYCKASGTPRWEVHCPGKAAISVLCHEMFHGVFGLRDEYYQNPQCPCVMRSAPNPQKLCTESTHLGGGRQARPCCDDILKRKNVKNMKFPNKDWTDFTENKRKMPKERTGGRWGNGGTLKVGALRISEPPPTKFTIVDN